MSIEVADVNDDKGIITGLVVDGGILFPLITDGDGDSPLPLTWTVPFGVFADSIPMADFLHGQNCLCP
jgi:hypothetical protein